VSRCTTAHFMDLVRDLNDHPVVARDVRRTKRPAEGPGAHHPLFALLPEQAGYARPMSEFLSKFSGRHGGPTQHSYKRCRACSVRRPTSSRALWVGTRSDPFKQSMRRSSIHAWSDSLDGSGQAVNQRPTVLPPPTARCSRMWGIENDIPLHGG